MGSKPEKWEENASRSVMDDEECVQLEWCLRRVQQGDTDAYERFYLKTKDRIFNFIYRTIGDYHASEELTQEVFVKAYRNISRYEARQKPLAWIYTIARNLCKNWFRARQVRRLLSLDAPAGSSESPSSLGDLIPGKGPGPDRLVRANEEHALLQGFIRSLPSPYRDVVVLCELQGCDYRTAAQVLKISVGTVGSRLARARLKIASHLKALCGQDKGVQA